MKKLILSLLLLATSAVIVQAQDVQEKRRDAVLNDKKHFDTDSYWVYDDYSIAGIPRLEAQARRNGADGIPPWRTEISSANQATVTATVRLLESLA